MTRKWRLTSGLCSTYESSETDPVRREWVTRCVGRGGFFIGHHLPLGYDPPAYALSLTQVISLAGSIVEDPLSFHQSTALPSTRKQQLMPSSGQKSSTLTFNLDFLCSLIPVFLDSPGTRLYIVITTHVHVTS